MRSCKPGVGAGDGRETNLKQQGPRQPHASDTLTPRSRHGSRYVEGTCPVFLTRPPSRSHTVRLPSQPRDLCSPISKQFVLSLLSNHSIRLPASTRTVPKSKPMIGLAIPRITESPCLPAPNS